MKRIRRIVFASDFSSVSKRALGEALTLTKALDARLTLIHVVAPFAPPVPAQYLDPVTMDRLDEQARQWARDQMTKLVATARKAGVTAAATVQEGDPVGRIVGLARATRADLVVVGTHGRRGLSKLPLGSVAERVVMTAPCPVVTVRGA